MSIFYDLLDRILGQKEEEVVRRPFSGFYPYQERTADAQYNMFFGDVMKFHVNEEDGEYPQYIINKGQPTEDELLRVINDDSLSSSTKYLICNIARKAGLEKIKGIFYGAVFEFRAKEGLQTLAVYEDLEVCLIERDGQIYNYQIGQNVAVDSNVQAILHQLRDRVRMVPDYQVRRLYPEEGEMRMTVLTSEGKYVTNYNALETINFKFHNRFWDNVSQVMQLVKDGYGDTDK